MRKRSAAWASILWAVVLLIGCSNTQQKQQDLVSYLDDLGQKYEQICVEMGTANWNLYSKEGEADQDTPKRKFSELLLDPEHMMAVDAWLAKIDKKIDPRFYRRLQVWKDVLVAARVDMDEDIYRLENQLEQEITDYKHDVDGELVPHRELRRALNTKFKDFAEANKKYEEYLVKMQEELEPRVLHLMKLRNAKSKEVGFHDYGELCLYMMGLLPEGSRRFYDILDEIDRKTTEPYKALLIKAKEKSGIEEINGDNLRQSIYALREPLPLTKNVSVDKPMDLTKETLRSIGFNLDELPIRIVEENIPYGGLGLAIEVPTDHRIVVQRGRISVRLLLHEIGHGLQAVHISWPEPIFHNYEWCLGAYSPAYDEGVADVIAGFAQNAEWQKKYSNKSEERIEAEQLNRRTTAPYSIRSQIAGFMFEIELYKNLDRDPEEVRKDLHKKWLMVGPSSNIRHNWATSVFPVAYPIYGQNYFLASIVDWQVHDYLKKHFGRDYIFNEDVSSWLKENLYAMGHGMHWMTRIENATGKKLDIEGYLASLGIF
jgi:hypothetical protein